jgi:hypothetical protein
MKKPIKCCNFGEYSCQIPMSIMGRRQDIDFCIADIVAALNAANITTVASCCGHKKLDGNILLEDGRELKIKFNNLDEPLQPSKEEDNGGLVFIGELTKSGRIKKPREEPECIKVEEWKMNLDLGDEFFQQTLDKYIKKHYGK